MLKHLTIRDMLIIDRLELEFSSGLNVSQAKQVPENPFCLIVSALFLDGEGAQNLSDGALNREVSASFELGAHHPAMQPLQEAEVWRREDVIYVREFEGRSQNCMDQ